MQKFAARTGGFQAFKNQEEASDKLNKTDRQWNTAKVISLHKQINYYDLRNTELEQELLIVDKDIANAQSDLHDLNKRIAYKPKTEVYRPSEAINEPVKALMTSVAVSQQGNRSNTLLASYCDSSTATGMKLKTTLKQLENNKDKRLVDLSSLLSQNKAMRGKIDELRREIMLNGQIIDSLNNEHGVELNQIMKMEDKIKGAEKVRDPLKAKYTLGLVSNKQHSRDLKFEVKEIKDDIHKENLQSLNRFRSTLSVEKNRATRSRYENISTLTKKDMFNEAAEETHQLKYSSENYNSGKIGFSYSLMGRNRQISDKELHELDEQKKKLEEDSQRYDAILRSFYSMTETRSDQNLDEAIRKYDQQNKDYEQENNDTRFWAEKLDSLMQLRDTIKQEIDIVKREKTVQWRHRDDLVAFYQQMILDNQDKMKAYNAKMDKNKEDLFSIQIAIPEIFRKIGCEPARDNLYQEKEVNDSNIEEYLSLIEKRADEILTMYHAKPTEMYQNNGGTSSQISASGSKSKLSQQKNREVKNNSVEKLIHKVLNQKSIEKEFPLVCMNTEKLQDNRGRVDKHLSELVDEELKSAVVN